MPLADFVHLRVHTAYSLSAGAIPVKELARRCKTERMPAVAITDTDNLFGALEFATACAASGVQPIIGSEVGLAADSQTARGKISPGAAATEPDRIVLLAQNETGYRNLLALSSRSYLAGEPGAEPAVGLADLTAAGDGPDLPHRRTQRAGGTIARRGSGGCRRGAAAPTDGGVPGPALYRTDAS